jgi:hypothetical protein
MSSPRSEYQYNLCFHKGQLSPGHAPPVVEISITEYETFPRTDIGRGEGDSINCDARQNQSLRDISRA